MPEWHAGRLVPVQGVYRRTGADAVHLDWAGAQALGRSQSKYQWYSGMMGVYQFAN